MYRRQVLRERFNGVDLHSDVRWVEKPWTELANIDMLAGGFPCQDTSQAGARAGIEGKKSGLWTHFDRLIGETNPRYVIIENVAGLRFRGMSTVLHDLSARGYDAEWETIPASTLGSPQRRDRVWIVGYRPHSTGNTVSNGSLRAMAHARRLTTTGQRTRSTVDRAQSGPAHAPGLLNTVGDSRPPLPDAVLQCCTGKVFCEHSLSAYAAYCQECYWQTDAGVGRVDHGLPASLDRNRRLSALGDALVPAFAEYLGLRVLSLALNGQQASAGYVVTRSEGISDNGTRGDKHGARSQT